MALIGVTGGLTLALIAFVWASLKLMLAGGAEYVPVFQQAYKAFLTVLLLIQLGPGVAAWLRATYWYLISLP